MTSLPVEPKKTAFMTSLQQDTISSSRTLTRAASTAPSLLVLEVIILALTFAWMYVGAVNYLFYARLGKSI